MKVWRLGSCENFLCAAYIPGGNFELILTVKMETRHPIERQFGSEFPAICNHCVVMTAWTRRPGNFVSNFAFFGKTTPMFPKFTWRHRWTLLCWNFVNIYRHPHWLRGFGRVLYEIWPLPLILALVSNTAYCAKPHPRDSWSRNQWLAAILEFDYCKSQEMAVAKTV